MMSLMQAGRSYSRFSSSRFITQITIHQIHGEGGEATHMRACTERFKGPYILLLLQIFLVLWVLRMRIDVLHVDKGRDPTRPLVRPHVRVSECRSTCDSSR